MNTIDFGRFLTNLRKEKGLTQLQLAEKLNVTDKAVSRWETGRNYPDIEMFEKLSDYFGVTVSELLEGKRIDKEDLIAISEGQVVEQIKEKKKISKKYRIIIAIVLIISLIFGYIAMKEHGIFDGVIYNKIDCYSNDILTILNNVDGYITQRPEAEGEFIINNGWIFIEDDKTTSNIYLSGTTENGRAFYVNTLYDELYQDNSYCFIGEFRENQEPVEGVSINTFKSVIAQLDLSLFEKKDKYQLRIIDIDTYDNTDLYINDYQASIRKFIYYDGILQQYTEKTLTGKYAMLRLSGFEDAVAYIFCEM